MLIKWGYSLQLVGACITCGFFNMKCCCNVEFHCRKPCKQTVYILLYLTISLMMMSIFSLFLPLKEEKVQNISHSAAAVLECPLRYPNASVETSFRPCRGHFARIFVYDIPGLPQIHSGHFRLPSRGSALLGRPRNFAPRIFWQPIFEKTFEPFT